jgi:predicted AAA+ superfamily ATPase
MNRPGATAPPPADQTGPGGDLLTLLAEWRQLTECETRAIRLGDWQDIAAHQARKERLRQAINESLRRGGPATTGLPGVKAAAAELIALESANHELIAAERQAREAEQGCVNRTARDLRGMRRAYGSADSSHWQSYS